MSYNSTGLDCLKTCWIRDLIKTCKTDFFQLQEHFKTTKSLDNFFRREFPSFDSFMTPGYREPFQDAGRAKGGLAQLSCNQLDIKKEKIPTKHWRNQAQILHLDSYRIIWINCYFPTDPQILRFNDQELSKVLEDIENTLDKNVFDDCILGGDLNFDISRRSGFANTVRDFLSRLELFSVWDKFPADFTHLHTDGKNTSTIDHFFVNQRLLDLVQDAGPVHLGDNPSRHSPIMMKIKIPELKTKISQVVTPPPRKPAWYKAAQADKDHYTSLLDSRLRALTVPDSLQCQNV